MVGPNFMAFVTMLVIAVVVSAVLHSGLHLRIAKSKSDHLYTLAMVYVGAWLGPVLVGGAGWFPGDVVFGVPYVPSILGALAAYLLIAKMPMLNPNRERSVERGG